MSTIYLLAFFAVLNQVSGKQLALHLGTIPIGESCLVDEDCLDYEESTQCDPVLKLCFCRDTHEPYRPPGGGPTICVGMVHKLGEECVIKSQCTKGVPGDLSDCLPSQDDPDKLVCSCVDEAINEPGEHKCYPKRFVVGEQCYRNAQCTANLGDLSTCHQEICRCIENAVPSQAGDKCLAIANRVGDLCEEPQQCYLGVLGVYSDCVLDSSNSSLKTCQCNVGYEPDPITQKCQKPSMLIGLPCESNEDCVGLPGLSSGCRSSKICACLGGHIPSKQRDDCLPIRNKLGDSCQEAEQCQRGIPGALSDCLNGICNCTVYSVAEPGNQLCLRKATLIGDACQINVQCEVNIGENSQCIGEECECKMGYVPSSDKANCVKLIDEEIKQ